MDGTTPTTLIIIGISGDLAKRKLLPALGAIERAGALPHPFTLVGTTRQEGMQADALGEALTPSIREHLELVTMDPHDPTAYTRLASHLTEIEKRLGTPTERLFYLSVPPSAVQEIVAHLGSSGLAKVPKTKLLLEKPFGVNRTSAQELVTHINASFSPEQVYRIDHYLAKQMAQNLMVFREQNALFRRTWNRDFLERVEIVASETIGIEQRAHFYEQTGALRDLVQSHLLQLAALTLMDLSPTVSGTVSDRRLEVLKSLSLAGTPRRGQYQGYRDEVGNASSTVETFVDLTLASSDPRWEGVPIRLVTGKRLSEKTTEIRLYYRQDEASEANELILRLQPNEGVTLALWVRRPGYENERESRTLDFTYADYYEALPEAYENVLVEVMRGDHDLFVSSEEVLESWRILEPVQELWASTTTDLVFYEPGFEI